MIFILKYIFPMGKGEKNKDNIFVRFFKKILDPTQMTSIKSLAMLTSIVISVGLSVCLGYSMIVDAYIDGILNMDLIDAGVFVTCLGSFMSLASIPKVLIDKVRAKRDFPPMHRGERIYETEEVVEDVEPEDIRR